MAAADTSRSRQKGPSVTGDSPHRPTRRPILWLVLAVSCAVAAGLDVFIAISMSELWPVAAAVCALLAAAACVWVAADELRRRRVRLAGAGGEPASRERESLAG